MNDRPKPTKSLEQHLAKPGKRDGTSDLDLPQPAGYITDDDIAQDAGFMRPPTGLPEPITQGPFPAVSIPRHMLEDTPPSPFEQIRDTIHPGRHAHPYDRHRDHFAAHLEPPRHRA